MERKALKVNLSAGPLSVALLSIAALAPAAHAQVASSGVNAGFGDMNNAAAVPGERQPLFVYGVDAGVGETDNVTLVPTDKVSQTMSIVDLDFIANEQSRLLDLKATGDFSDLDYLQGAYGNQLIGRFDGIGKVAIIPGRLTWTVQDDFGQGAVDPYTPLTPTNLEDINYFNTGPDLSIRLGGIDFLNLSARYGRAQYQTTPFDSNRLSGSVALGRDLSAASAVSLNGSFERVMFDNTLLNTDFDRTSAYGRYELHGARTTFTANLGATTINESGTSTTGGLATLELSRKLSAAATLTFTAGRQLTDSASSFSSLQPGAIGVVGTGPAAQTSENYRSTYASAGWQYSRYRTKLAVSALWEQDTYPGQPELDLKRPGVELNLERRLTHAFSAQLLGRWYKTEYPHATLGSEIASSNETGIVGAAVIPESLLQSQYASTDYEDGLVGASLIWRHGRGLEVRMRYEHTSHVVSTGAGGYQENRAFLTIGYRPGALATRLPEYE